MKQKLITRVLLTVVAMVIAAVICTNAVTSTTVTTEAASKKYTVINVTKAQIKSKGAYQAIQAALDTAKSKATAKKPYKIVVAKGSYKLTNALHIYSNTYLELTGVTLTMKANTNLIVTGTWDDTHTGYYYKNITINGGTLNENKRGKTLLKIAHVQNFTLTNCTLKNTKNGHLMELAGAKNVTITGCTFKDQVISKTSGGDLYYEAIQIDILQEFHYTGYRWEDLANKNIVIDDCTFSNVPRGVGSHTGVLNNPVNGVSITNCTFKKCKSAAIQGQNWINVTISGNTITNCPRGIYLYTIRTQGTYLGKTLAASGKTKSKTSSKYKKPKANQKIVISDNSISISGSDKYATYESAGIYVEGLNLTSKYTTTNALRCDSLPKGNYYMSGVTISGNTINSANIGIRAVNVRKLAIKDNTITYTGKSTSASGQYGIQLREKASATSISGNTVTAFYVGIYLNSTSTATTIADNLITTPTRNGIRVESSSKVTTISGNTIDNPGEDGICVRDSSTASTVCDNIIANPGGKGVKISSGSSTLSNNTVVDSLDDLVTEEETTEEATTEETTTEETTTDEAA